MHVLVLGTGASQLPYITRLKARGCRVTGVDMPSNTAAAGHCDLVLNAGINEINAVWQSLEQAGIAPSIDRVIAPAGHGQAMWTWAVLNHRLGLNGLPAHAARLVLHKQLLRETFNQLQQQPLPYKVVKQYGDLITALDKLGYPAVIKPDTGAISGRGVTVVTDRSQLETAFRFALAQAGNEAVVVEPYISGVEMEVNAIYQNHEFRFFSVGETIVDTDNTGMPVGKTLGRGCPVFIGQVVEEALLAFCEKLQVDALILQVDFILDRRGGLYFIDVKYTLSDVLHTAPLCYDYDLPEQVINAYLGETVKTATPPYAGAAIRYFLHPTPQSDKVNIDENLPDCLVDYEVNERLRTKYQHNGNYYYMWGNVLVKGEDQQAARQNAETAMQYFHFVY